MTPAPARSFSSPWLSFPCHGGPAAPLRSSHGNDRLLAVEDGGHAGELGEGPAGLSRGGGGVHLMKPADRLDVEY
ncbi:hypothetical protein [Methanosphaerula subterraneus]|uniref:hypothetical protein n=1 Tax=Methanosphaerula subterraneus TaxID=3350244 RepID=UPI003F82CE50